MQKPIIRPLPCPRCGTPYALSILRLDISDRWRVEARLADARGLTARRHTSGEHHSYRTVTHESPHRSHLT